MTISQALKEKNRITGRINTLQQQLYKFNRYNKNKTPDLDAEELMESLQKEWAYLINLKSKIARANVGIAESLIRLSEAKAELKFWQGFVNAGPALEIVTETVYDYSVKNHVNKETPMVSVYTSKQVLENTQRVQTEIENLQDSVDTYNATTQI